MPDLGPHLETTKMRSTGSHPYSRYYSPPAKSKIKYGFSENRNILRSVSKENSVRRELKMSKDSCSWGFYCCILPLFVSVVMEAFGETSSLSPTPRYFLRVQGFLDCLAAGAGLQVRLQLLPGAGWTQAVGAFLRSGPGKTLDRKGTA